MAERECFYLVYREQIQKEIEEKLKKYKMTVGYIEESDESDDSDDEYISFKIKKAKVSPTKVYAENVYLEE